METYHKLLKLLIQANQACPRLTGKIYKFNKGNTKPVEVIPGNQAKLGVLLRCYILVIVSCSMVLRVGYLQKNKTNGKLNTSEKVYMNLCAQTFFIFILNTERYRSRGYFPENFVTFVNSLSVMEARYFKGNIT